MKLQRINTLLVAGFLGCLALLVPVAASGAPEAARRLPAGPKLEAELGVTEHRFTVDRRMRQSVIRSVDARGRVILELETRRGRQVEFRRYAADGKLLDAVKGSTQEGAAITRSPDEQRLGHLAAMYVADVSPRLKSLLPCEAECALSFATCAASTSGVGMLICMGLLDWCLYQCPMSGGSSSLPPGRCLVNGDCNAGKVCAPLDAPNTKLTIPGRTSGQPREPGTCIPAPPRSCETTADCGKDEACIQSKCMAY